MQNTTLVRVLAGLVFATTLGSLSACTAQSICSKKAECAEPSLEDDSVNVCIEGYNARDASLRANREDDCHRLADALAAFDACRAGLDCDDFEENDLGEKCDDEIDDLEEALDDAGDKCSARN